MLNFLWLALWLFQRFGGALIAIIAYKSGDTFDSGVVVGLGLAALICGIKQVYEDFKH